MQSYATIPNILQSEGFNIRKSSQRIFGPFLTILLNHINLIVVTYNVYVLNNGESRKRHITDKVQK